MLSDQTRRRVLGCIVLLASLTLARRATAQQGMEMICKCSAGGNYVCCQWIGDVFNGCNNWGHVPGQCGN
jgi:hypothetical protein